MAHDSYMIVQTHSGRYTILNYESHQKKSEWYKHNVKRIIHRDLLYTDALKYWHELNETTPKESEDYNG